MIRVLHAEAVDVRWNLPCAHCSLLASVFLYHLTVLHSLSLAFVPPPPPSACLRLRYVCRLSHCTLVFSLDREIKRFWQRRCCSIEVKSSSDSDIMSHSTRPHLPFEPHLPCWVKTVSVEDTSSSLSWRSRHTRHQLKTVVECRTTCLESSTAFCSRHPVTVIHCFHSLHVFHSAL